jgi:predicted nucleic acid-binding Zn ribbon protein
MLVGKRSEPARLRELLEPQARRAGIESAVLVGRVWELWPDIVGPDVAAHAEPTSLRKSVLRVRTDSPAWSTELSYFADELRKRINDAVGSALVSEVRVWSGAGPIADHSKSDRKIPEAPASATPGGDPIEALRRARRAWSRGRKDAS